MGQTHITHNHRHNFFWWGGGLVDLKVCNSTLDGTMNHFLFLIFLLLSMLFFLARKGGRGCNIPCICMQKCGLPISKYILLFIAFSKTNVPWKLLQEAAKIKICPLNTSRCLEYSRFHTGPLYSYVFVLTHEKVMQNLRKVLPKYSSYAHLGKLA